MRWRGCNGRTGRWRSSGTKPDSARSSRARYSFRSTTTASPGSREQINVTTQSPQASLCCMTQVSQSMVKEGEGVSIPTHCRPGETVPRSTLCIVPTHRGVAPWKFPSPRRQHAKRSSAGSTGPIRTAPGSTCANAHCASACVASRSISTTTTM